MYVCNISFDNLTIITLNLGIRKNPEKREFWKVAYYTSITEFGQIQAGSGVIA